MMGMIIGNLIDEQLLALNKIVGIKGHKERRCR